MLIKERSYWPGPFAQRKQQEQLLYTECQHRWEKWRQKRREGIKKGGSDGGASEEQRERDRSLSGLALRMTEQLSRSLFILCVYVSKWVNGCACACACACVYALNQFQDGKIKDTEDPLMSSSKTISVKHQTKQHSTFFTMLFTHQSNITRLQTWLPT